MPEEKAKGKGDFFLNSYQKKAWITFNIVFKKGFTDFNSKYHYFDEISGQANDMSEEPKWRDEDYLYSGGITEISYNDPETIKRVRMIIMAANYSLAYCFGNATDENGIVYPRIEMSEEYADYYRYIYDAVSRIISPAELVRFSIRSGKNLAENLLAYAYLHYKSECKKHSMAETRAKQHQISLDDEEAIPGGDIPAPVIDEQDSGDLSALGRFYSYIRSCKGMSGTARDRLIAILLEKLVCKPCCSTGDRNSKKTDEEKELDRKIDLSKYMAYVHNCFAVSSKTGRCRNDFIDVRLRNFCLDFPRAVHRIPNSDDFRLAVSCFEFSDKLKKEPQLPNLFEIETIEQYMTSCLSIKKRIITPHEYLVHIREMASDAAQAEISGLIAKYADKNEGLIRSDAWKMTLSRARDVLAANEKDIRELLS